MSDSQMKNRTLDLIKLFPALLLALISFTGLGAQQLSYAIIPLWGVLFGLSVAIICYSFSSKSYRKIAVISLVCLLVSIIHFMLASMFGYEPFWVWPVN